MWGRTGRRGTGWGTVLCVGVGWRTLPPLIWLEGRGALIFRGVVEKREGGLPKRVQKVEVGAGEGRYTTKGLENI